MANKTEYLGLELPANGEYNDTWDVVVNENFIKIDEESQSIGTEVQQARGTKSSLSDFLSVAHYSDGSLKPTDESTAATNSPIYGAYFYVAGTTISYTLRDRLNMADFETFDAREQSATLQDNLARRADDFNYANTVINGANTAQGFPNFMAVSGAEFHLNGDPEKIVFNITAYLMELQVDLNIPVTGADGNKYLIAQKPTEPIKIIDKSAAASGVAAVDATRDERVRVLYDTSVNFAGDGVRPGMVVNVFNTENIGRYLVDTVSHEGNIDKITVVGEFSTAVGGINYTITDPTRPEFVVEDLYSPADGKCLIGEASLTAGALLSEITYAFKDKYDSTFIGVDVSSTPTFELIFNHNLGEIPSRVELFGAQYVSAWVSEPLSVSHLENSLTVTTNNTLTFTPGVFDPGSTDATYIQGSLVGDVTTTLGGDIFDARAVRVKTTRTQVFVKNVRDNHFYRDYDGVDHNTGYIRVVCSK